METGILVYSDSGAILKSFGILLIREGGGKSERRILATENGKSWAMLKLFLALLHLPQVCFVRPFYIYQDKLRWTGGSARENVAYS